MQSPSAGLTRSLFAPRRSHSRRLAIATAMLLAVLGSVTGLTLSNRSAPVETMTSGTSPTRAGLQRVGSSGETVTARRDGIMVRFTLERPTIRKAGTLQGTLSIVTTKAVRGCRGKFYAIVLSSPSTGKQGGAFPTPACDTVVIGPGRNNYRVSSPARYGACTNNRAVTRLLPHCLRLPVLFPALPVGIYTAKLAFDLNLPVPPAVSVRIVAS